MCSNVIQSEHQNIEDTSESIISQPYSHSFIFQSCFDFWIFYIIDEYPFILDSLPIFVAYNFTYIRKI